MFTIRHILCPIDFSDTSLRALEHAVALGGWYESSLTAMFVESALPVTDASPFVGFVAARDGGVDDVHRSGVLGDMRCFVNRAARAAAIHLELEESPDVHGVIVARAAALPADLIVMGSHGRSGLKGVLLGSVAERVLRAAPCPVMVVPPHDAVPPSTACFKHIVCAIDFSESSIDALTWSLSLAEEADAHLALLHVLEVPPELRLSTTTVSSENLDELHLAVRAATLTRLRSLVPSTAAAFCSVETATAAGAAGREVLKFAADRHADLIVMGARGQGAVERMVFGSKTLDVVRGARCPVLAIRR